MEEAIPHEGENRIEDLKMLFQVDFISRAFFKLVYPSKIYSPLLVINHNEGFLSLSNENFYFILLQEKQNILRKEAEEHLTYIQNRKKLLVWLHGTSEPNTEMGNRINTRQITAKAIQDGIPKNNLYLKILNELLHE